MILDKFNETLEYEGKKYSIGQAVIATNQSDYNGLIGYITEIRDGEDKDTENETPDIYCEFEVPTLACEIKSFEKLFTSLYGEPKTIDEIALDQVIMAPEMVMPLSEISKTSCYPNAAITRFDGEFEFLSNFYWAKVQYGRFTYRNSEAAFQGMKNPDTAYKFTDLSPSQAKLEGRCRRLRPDWESVKEQIMYEICLAKFSQNPKLKDKLLATKDMTLIEGNSWGDTEWGICDGKGQNKLGKILMCVREELR